MRFAGSPHLTAGDIVALFPLVASFSSFGFGWIELLFHNSPYGLIFLRMDMRHRLKTGNASIKRFWRRASSSAQN